MNIARSAAAIPHQLRRATVILLVMMAWAGTLQHNRANAGTDDSLEYSVKGAYLLKFGDFIEWPASAFPVAGMPLQITVLGEDPFGAKLEQMSRGRTAAGRTIVVKRTKSIEDARNAHILYISQSERSNLKAILASLHDRSVLTVADFDQPGIVIAFVIGNDKVRFDVNLDHGEQAGLKLSSKLLSVARTVKGK